MPTSYTFVLLNKVPVFRIKETRILPTGINNFSKECKAKGGNTWLTAELW